MTTKKRAISRPVDGLVRHPGLYRAQLSCKIGRDAIEGKTTPPEGVTPMEWSMFNLLHAVEEIVTAMMPNARPHGGRRKGRMKPKRAISRPLDGLVGQEDSE